MQNNVLSRQIDLSNAVRCVLVIIGFLEGIVLLFFGNNLREGLGECLWLLPVTFSICFLLKAAVFDFHKDGIALKIYYTVLVCRYLILPYTIYLSNGETGYYMPSVNYSISYWVAIIVMCLELIISVVVIEKTYMKTYKKTKHRIYNTNKYKCNTITSGGWIIIAILCLILLVRINYVIPSTNIILIKDSADDAGVWYEAIIVNCIKAFGFAMLMQKIYKSKGSKINIIYYIMAVVLALANFGIYYGSNRAYIVMTLIATLFIYMYIYPQYKLVSMAVLIPVGIVCVVTMFINKQFGVELSDFSTSTLSIQSISNIIELYVGGPWNYASGFEAAFGRYLPDIGMIIAGYIQKFALANIPGFKWLRYIEYACTPLYGTDVYAWDAYQTSLGIYGNSQILSGVMEILVMYGLGIGWIVSFVYQIWISRMIVKIECYGKLLYDIGYKYMYAWLGVMFGMYMCYSPALLLWVWSKFALFYWLMLKFNDKIRLGGTGRRL